VVKRLIDPDSDVFMNNFRLIGKSEVEQDR